MLCIRSSPISPILGFSVVVHPFFSLSGVPWLTVTPGVVEWRCGRNVKRICTFLSDQTSIVLCFFIRRSSLVGLMLHTLCLYLPTYLTLSWLPMSFPSECKVDVTLDGCILLSPRSDLSLSRRIRDATYLTINKTDGQAVTCTSVARVHMCLLVRVSCKLVICHSHSKLGIVPHRKGRNGLRNGHLGRYLRTLPTMCSAV